MPAERCAVDGKSPATDVASRTFREVGGFIREQRTQAQLSVRKLARMAGVSDPYLSQVERGLRRPSADVLQRVADALQVRAETLYYKAGILSEPADDLSARIMTDPHLTEPQKRALLEVYESFRGGEAGRSGPASEGVGRPSAVDGTEDPGRSEDSHGLDGHRPPEPQDHHDRSE